MTRPPLPLETWGKINRAERDGRPAAIANYRDSDGRTRRVQRTGRTYADAERRLLEALRDRLAPSGQDLTRESTLGSLADRWIESVRRERRAAATIAKYDATVARHVRPLEDIRLREVSVPRLQRLIDSISDSSGPAAARMTKVVLTGMFDLAVRLGGADSNPATPVKVPRVVTPAVRAPTVDEIQQLRAALRRWDETKTSRTDTRRDLSDIADVMLGTGARIGEVLALRWADVDLEANTLTVRATVVRMPGEGLVIQEHPKSQSSERKLHLPQFTVKVLDRLSAESSGELVFPSLNGTPRWPENIRTAWAQAVADTPVSWMTTRVCRKAVATLLADEHGIEAAKEQLGHHNSSVTKKHYVPRQLERPNVSPTLDGLA
ncbi:site-specific integrase [Plantibacter sp. MMLR14_011]|uniref:tyrosine-type recombinase/integrase n=1 Tax=Plantibacter sp. MMLR14_011 TaxID=1898746 RepID=UPI0009F672C4